MFHQIASVFINFNGTQFASGGFIICSIRHPPSLNPQFRLKKKFSQKKKHKGGENSNRSTEEGSALKTHSCCVFKIWPRKSQSIHFYTRKWLARRRVISCEHEVTQGKAAFHLHFSCCKQIQCQTNKVLSNFQSLWHSTALNVPRALSILLTVEKLWNW